MAYVVLKTDRKLSATDLAKWVNARLSNHKHITGGIRFVEEVPKSPSGKIERVKVRKWAAEEATRLAAAPKAKL
jgi:4-coumarate--CoA ligase